jgi:DNA-binding beta-propeller fold protein YncE
VIGENIILVGPATGIVIYKVLPDYSLNQYARVTEFNGKLVQPVGLSVDENNGLLYVLDQSRNIYIFTFK